MHNLNIYLLNLNYAISSSIIKTQALEAKLEEKQKGSPYGEAMLINLQKRLTELEQSRGKDINYCPYEVLKGLVGMLTGECKIAFSEVPVGGWRFNGEITD